VVALAGRFDAVEAPRVRERMAGADLASARALVFDLSEVTFLDSAGLAVLVRARQDRLRSGGSVTLVRPASDDAMRVLRLTRFDQLFSMVDEIP
jgi:anti-anti-sigma factor